MKAPRNRNGDAVSTCPITVPASIDETGLLILDEDTDQVDGDGDHEEEPDDADLTRCARAR